MQTRADLMYIIKHHVLSMLQGSESTAPNILDLCTKQRKEVSFTPWTLDSHWQFTKKVGGSRGWFGFCHHGGGNQTSIYRPSSL